jgi:hypothetical protein
MVERLPEPAARARMALVLEALFPLGEAKTDRLQGILAAIASAPHGIVQLAISPDVHWQRQACRRLDQLSGIKAGRSLFWEILLAPIEFVVELFLPTFSPPATPQGATVTATAARPKPPADKAYLPGYRAELRLRVAGTNRDGCRSVMHAVVTAYRAVEGRNGLRPMRVWSGKGFDRDLIEHRPPRTKGLVLSPGEVAQLYHLPCATPAMVTAPVKLLPAVIPSAPGELICYADDLKRTPIRLAFADAMFHKWLTASTGAGKSTALANGVLDVIASGHGCCAIDPKGDLIRVLLERIPRSEWDRVILIDPARRNRPVGINVLQSADPEQHELVSEQVVTIFRRLFDQYWGPRTDDIMRSVVLTLLHHPPSTLCEVPLLLNKPEARERYIHGLDDPVGLDAFWDEYARWGDAQRVQAVGPVLNKLRSVLLRPTVRNILGQAESTIDIADAMDHGGIVLISLAKGLLGEETSRLLGAILVTLMWQAAMARADRPETERPYFHLYLDEFQNYLHLPHSFDDVLVEARGYRLGLTLAHQHLSQLHRGVRDALSANAHTRVIFQSGPDEARAFAREFEPLTEHNLRSLQRFQVAVRLCVDGRVQPAFTGTTRPLPESLGASHGFELADYSLARHGRDRYEVEQEIRDRFTTEGLTPETDPNRREPD